MNTNTAPYPEVLDELVKLLVYRPGWTFELKHMQRGQGSEGLTLDIVTSGYNSYHPEQGEHYSVHHFFPVPPASYNRQSWVRWLFEQCLLVERHEAMEFFRFRQDSIIDLYFRPYAPNHGPGNDPYTVREITTEEERKTSFRGVMKE